MIPTRKKTIKTIVSAFLVCALSIPILWLWGIPTFLEGQASNDWQPTEGYVESCSIGTTKNSEGKETFKINIKYSYSVDGKNYLGNRIRVADANISQRSKAKAIRNSYTSDRQVEVYYNPLSHGDAVLVKGTTFSVVLLNIVVLIVSASAFFALIKHLLRLFL